MTLSTTMMQNDLDTIMADFAQSIVFSGSTYSAAITDITDEDDLRMAGIVEQQGFQVTISKDDFSTLPTVGDIISISGTEYRVMTISDGACGLSRTLICGGKEQ